MDEQNQILRKRFDPEVVKGGSENAAIKQALERINVIKEAPCAAKEVEQTKNAVAIEQVNRMFLWITKEVDEMTNE